MKIFNSALEDFLFKDILLSVLLTCLNLENIYYIVLLVQNRPFIGHQTLTQLIESHCNVFIILFKTKMLPSFFSYKLDIICLVKIQQILIKSLILLLLLLSDSRLILVRCDLDHPPDLSCWYQLRLRPTPEPSEIPAVAYPAPFGPEGRPLSSWAKCWEGTRRRGRG